MQASPDSVESTWESKFTKPKHGSPASKFNTEIHRKMFKNIFVKNYHATDLFTMQASPDSVDSKL